MRILIDTDVLLDVALERSPFVESSADVLRWVERGGRACIAWHSLANCAYLLEKDGRSFLSQLLTVLVVAPVGHRDAQVALKLPISDFEDALQVAAAQAWSAQKIITRKIRDYKRSPILACTPEAFLKAIRP
jgi:predicted nucleic acid-binding protein